MASVTGKDGDNYIVTHEDLSAPARLDQLQPYPDLYSQALGFDPLAPTTTIPARAQGGFNPDNLIASPLALGKDLVTGGPDAVAARLIGNTPQDGGTVTVPGVNVADTPPPAPGTDGMAPPAAPSPAAPGGAIPTPQGVPIAGRPVARGTGGAAPRAPRAPAGPDGLTAGYQAQLSGEAAKEGAENKVYDANDANRQAEAQAFAAKQAELQANRDAAFKQQMDLQDQAAKAHNLDPNKWWADKSSLGKIFFQVANLMNGAAVGAGGHPGDAGAFIDDQIKRNLEIQEKRANALDKSAEAKGNLVQYLRQAGLDNAAAHQAFIAIQKENLATDLLRAAQKPGMDGQSPALKIIAGRLQVESTKGNVDLAHTRAQTTEALSSANASNASAGKTRMETAKLSQTTGADAYARKLAAAGQPIPKALALLTSPEVQKNITGDGQLLTSDASEANKVTATSAPHLATLKNAMRIVNDPKASPLSKKQAAQDAYASAKVYMGLKRGGGEDEQAMASMAPGLREALGADINWASPGASARAVEALQNEIVNVQRRSSAEGQAYGRQPTPGANIDASPGWR